jgi:GH3 auxin-responsive promoter
MLTRMIAFWVAQGAKRRLKKFEQSLGQCRKIQLQLLLKILHTNQGSDYGRQHGFDSIGTYANFIQAIPLSNYSYLRPYIDRCRQGETSALFGPDQDIVQYALTSGTTAPAKYIPVTRDFLRTYQRGWEIWGYKAIFDHPDSYLRKILQVTGDAEEQFTESGVPCGAISGVLAKHQRYIVRKFYVTPYCISQVPIAADRYYSIMRFAIVQDIAFISTANPSTILALAQTAAERVETLIRDVHDGTLDKNLSLPREMRKQFEARLSKNPTRAKELEGIVQEHGRLLPMHYWNLSFLAHWTGGTLGMYLPRLAEFYGPTPIRDIGLLASEGRITIPMADNTPEGVLDIHANFYEFVPQEEYDQLDDPQGQNSIERDLTVLQGSQLEKDKCYYIFLTNYAGLYRYNLGDLVRVTGHIDTTPVLEFLSKGAHSSSITGEKLTEKQVVDAVRTVADELAIALESFIVVPQWDNPPHYRLYLAANQPLPRQDLDRLAQRIEVRLEMSNIEYESKRDSERLGMLEVRQVPARVLTEKDEQQLQANQGRREQFKHRFLYNEPLELE